MIESQAQNDDGQPSAATTATGVSFLSLFDPATHYPIFESLASHLPLLSLIFLRQTCRSFNSRVSSLWNADRYISRYVSSPRSLRRLMRQCNAIIAGSLPLQFFERARWDNTTLDILVKLKYTRTIASHLIKDGCELTSSSAGDGESRIIINEQTEGTVRVRKFDEAAGGILCRTEEWMEGRMSFTYTSLDIYTHPVTNRVIRLYSTPSTPLQSVLVGTPTTVGLNFFTWNKAYSLFPMHTCVLRRGYVLHSCKDPLFEYSVRGWRYGFSMDNEADLKAKYLLRRRIRCVADESSWVVKFDPLDDRDVKSEVNTDQMEFRKKEGAVPDYVTELAMFRLVRADYHSFELQNYRMKTSEFVEPSPIRYVNSLDEPAFSSEASTASAQIAVDEAALMRDLSVNEPTISLDLGSGTKLSLPTFNSKTPLEISHTGKLLKYTYLKRGEFFDSVYSKLLEISAQYQKVGLPLVYLDHEIPRVWEGLRMSRLREAFKRVNEGNNVMGNNIFDLEEGRALREANGEESTQIRVRRVAESVPFIGRNITDGL